MDDIAHLLPEWLSTIAVPALAVGGVCWKGDELISEEARKAIGSSLKHPDLSHLSERTALIISDIVNYIYGDRHFSRFCVWRVFIISQLSALLVFLYISHHYMRLDYSKLVLTAVAVPWISLLYIILTTSINVVSDYLSILKTRYFIYRLSLTKHLISFLLFPFIDLILTVLIFVLIFQFMTIAIPTVIIGLGHVLVDLSPEFRDFLFNNPSTQLMILSMLLASCVTTIWITLFSLVFFVMYLLFRGRVLVDFFAWLSNAPPTWLL